MKIIDRFSGKELSNSEILEEINRDHSDQWINYNGLDLKNNPLDILEWIDQEYFEVIA